MSRTQVLCHGALVQLRHPSSLDRDEFLTLVKESRSHHRPWAFPPADEEAFDLWLRRSRRSDTASFLVCRTEDRAVAGVVNASQIFMGSFRSAYLGYYSFSRFAGLGYMTEGLELVIGYAFGSMGLHRLEANIQPGNEASIALVRRCGFRREGLSPRYLQVGERWRDHERWAILAEDVVPAVRRKI